jgi:hypothetical protein
MRGASYLSATRRRGPGVEKKFNAPENSPQVARPADVRIHMTSHQFSYPKVSAIVVAPTAHQAGAQRPAPLPATR